MSPTDKSQSVARGAITVVAMRWTDRLIGIVSTLILARLLMPADFGIVAMASLVVALIDTLLDLGVNSALVQNRNAGKEDFDTAWTMRLLQNLLAAGAIATFGAPLAADYFNDPRVADVLRVMSLTLLISGFENIGVVLFQKNMEFGREFRYFFLRRLIGFIITVGLALWLRSYWAMVLGTLAGRLAGVWLSYILHEYRPRLSFEKSRSLWSFSQWMLVRNLGTFGAQQFDKILVGRRVGASSLGAYALADEIAAMPTGELLAPIGRVLFPAFVRAAHSPPELQRIFLLALGVQTLLALPAGIGLALVAPTLVPLALGPHWLGAIPLIQWLSLVSVIVAISHSGGYLLLTLGKIRTLALLSWGQLGLLASLTLIAFPSAGAEGIAQLRVIAALGAGAAVVGLVVRDIPELKFRQLCAMVLRPGVATIVMALVLTFWAPSALFSSNLTRLFVDVLIGGLVYAIALLALWRIFNCPDGAESYLMDKAKIKRRVLSVLRCTRE